MLRLWKRPIVRRVFQVFQVFQVIKVLLVFLVNRAFRCLLAMTCRGCVAWLR